MTKIPAVNVGERWARKDDERVTIIITAVIGEVAFFEGSIHRGYIRLDELLEEWQISKIT